MNSLLNRLLLLAAVIIAVAMWYREPTVAAEDTSDKEVGTDVETEPSSQPVAVALTSRDREHVCIAFAATIGTMVDFRDVTVATRGEVLFVEYVRADDGTTWTYACKLEANRVIWASVESGKVGRWRTEKEDGVISYSLSDDTVTITQSFLDGSRITEVHERD